MRVLLLIGWRNLARRKGRTAATCGMLFIGSFLIVFMTGMAEGTYGSMIEVGTRTYNGDFEVLSGDYQDKPSLFKTVTNYKTLGDGLARDPRVSGIAYRVESPGLFSHDNDTLGGLLVGMDPAMEICSYTASLSEGQWWREFDDKLPAVIGKGVAKRLRVGLGSEIAYVGQGADGSIAAELFTVVGLIDSGIDALDRNVVFVPLQSAQELLVLEGKVHRLVGLVHDRGDLPSLARDHRFEAPLHLMTWQELLPNLAHTIKADRKGGYFFLVIILAVVLISVANTMLMSVMERTHELGVIQALGTSPPMVVVIVLAEIFFLALLGITPGVLVATAINAWYGHHGIHLGIEDFSYGGVELGVIHTLNTWTGSLIFPALVLVGAILAGLLPALKAARMSAVDAIRD